MGGGLREFPHHEVHSKLRATRKSNSKSPKSNPLIPGDRQGNAKKRFLGGRIQPRVPRLNKTTVPEPDGVVVRVVIFFSPPSLLTDPDELDGVVEILPWPSDRRLYDVRRRTGSETRRWLGLNKEDLVFISKCG